MKNCFILGSGRSGTSMVAGTLAKSGYYMGDNLYPERGSNPKGFFEGSEINGINEELLAQVLPARPPGILGKLFRSRPVWNQYWLASVPLYTQIPCPPGIAQRIEAQTAKSPFCFKDPRFCYTLPAWRPFLQNTVFLCVFREPARTAFSILKECRDEPYLHGLSMNYSKAVSVWTLMYRHILEIHRAHGFWLFIHYDQVLDGSANSKIETALKVHMDHQFPDSKLKRSSNDSEVGSEALSVYVQLCELAKYPCPKVLLG